MRYLPTCLLFVAMSLGGSVRAGEPASVPTQSDHPCKTIMAACEAAGFKKGHHSEKKGLILDCVEPLLKGQQVPGVTVSESDLAACKAKQAERPNKAPLPPQK